MGQNTAVEFERLYAEYGPAIFRFCYRLTGNQTEAEDLTQDVFVAALTGGHRFRNESSEKTWLFRIAAYKTGERNRKRKRFASLSSETFIVDPDLASRLELERRLDRLPEKLKVAFVLVKLDQFTSAEAAGILGIPEGTVKFHVFSAIQQLRDPHETGSSASNQEIYHAM